MIGFQITEGAVETAHKRLKTYAGTDLEDETVIESESDDEEFSTKGDLVFEEIEEILHEKLREARNTGKVFPVHDTYDGDYSREIYRLEFPEDDVVLFGVVADNHRRGFEDPPKTLITVLSQKQAAASVKNNRWKSLDGSDLIATLGIALTEAPVVPEERTFIEGSVTEGLLQAWDAQKTKRCTGACGQDLPLDRFYKDRGAYRSRCKVCYRSSLKTKKPAPTADLQQILNAQAIALKDLLDAKGRLDDATARLKAFVNQV